MSDWKPTEKQIEALERTEFEVLFGGARGGGKSDAGMAWLLYDIDKPLYRALVIRRNADDLRDWVDRATRMFAKVGGEKKGTPAEFHFPSGAVIRTGHLKDDDAFTKYQGHEYHKILIEELTQIAKEQNYLMLIASCRSTVKGIHPQVFATTNPGGAGHKWVKDRFIDVAESGKRFLDEKTGRSRIFIAAKVQDNPYLMEADPDYVHMLDGLPDGLRQAWRDGSWDDVEIDGAYYSQQLTFVHQQNRVIDLPVEIGIPVHTFWDLGVSDSTAIWFVQLVGNDVRWVDYYESSGEGLQHYMDVIKNKGYTYGNHYAPHDIEVREYTTGISRIETARKMGINFQIVQNISIADGIDALRQVLYYSVFDRERTEVGLYALKNYRKEWNEKMQEYKPNPLHDWTSHAADAARYAAVTVNNLRNIQSKSRSIDTAFEMYD
jgi:hypothetical protein